MRRTHLHRLRLLGHGLSTPGGLCLCGGGGGDGGVVGVHSEELFFSRAKVGEAKNTDPQLTRQGGFWKRRRQRLRL